MKNSKITICGLVAFVVILLVFNIKSNSKFNELNTKYNNLCVTKQSDVAVENEEVKEEPAETEKKEVKTVDSKKEYTFTNGNFICGKNFAPGTYNVVAVKGNGSVTCMEAELFATLGDKSGPTGKMYQKEYKNIEFKDGYKLKINRVTLKLVRVD